MKYTDYVEAVMTRKGTRQNAGGQKVSDPQKETLKAIYGPYADKIYTMARMGPGNLKSATDGTWRNTANTLSYFIDYPDKINTDELCKILKVSKDEYLENIKNARIAEPQTATANENKTSETRVGATISGADSSFAAEIVSVETPTAQNTAARDALKEDLAAQVGSEPSSPANDLKNEKFSTKIDERQSSKEGLLEACFDVFGKRRSQGAVLSAYLDNKGLPTIGCGHLIWDKETDPKKAKKDFVDDMKAIGVNEASAGVYFDNLIKKKNSLSTQKTDDVNVITSPRLTLTEEQAKKLFKRDVESAYKKAIEAFPDLHSYPIQIQTSIVHHAYSFGNMKGLKAQCKENYDIQNIVNTMQKMRGNNISVHTACELRDSCNVAGVSPNSVVQKKLDNYKTSAKSYDKKVSNVLLAKWVNGDYSK